jgi:hypothetical protein
MTRRRELHVLINPPVHDVGEGVFVNHPTGLLKVGAWLLRQGHDVRLVDACPAPRGGFDRSRLAERHGPVDVRACGVPGPGRIAKPRWQFGRSREWLRARIRALRRVDRFWIGSSMTFHCEGVHQAVEACRRERPGVPVTVGGIYATLCAEHAGRSGAEVVAGQVPEACDLPPAWELLGPPQPAYAIVKTTRGCPRRCSYCAVRLLEGPDIRHRPIDDALDEMGALYRRGVREFVFWESNATLDAERYLEPLLDRMARRFRDIRISFPEGFDPRDVTPSLCRRLFRAGCRRVTLSLESIDAGLRRRFGKAGAPEDYLAALARLREAGFRTAHRIGQDEHGLFTFVLVGLPGQSVESILRTIMLVWRHGALPLLMRFTPIPGTREYVRHAGRFAGQGLEGLAPGLWPGATRETTAASLEEIYRRCHGVLVPPERQRALLPETPILATLRRMAGEPTGTRGTARSPRRKSSSR